MTVTLIESWARYPVNGASVDTSGAQIGWTASSSSAAIQISTTEQRNGLACAGRSSSASSLASTRALPTSQTVATVGAAYKCNSFASSGSNRPFGIGFVTSSAGRLCFGIDNVTQELNVYSNNTIIATVPTILALGVYNYIEMRVNTITGDIDIWINATFGAPPTFSFNYGGGNPLVSLTIRAVSTNGGGSVWFDDIYVSDGTQYGDSVADTRFVNSDGALQDWVPSSGSDGYAMLDNAPPTADYVEASTLGDISQFGTPNPSAVVYQVHAVSIQSRAVRTGASVEEFKHLLSDGVNTVDGATEVVPQTTPGLFNSVFNTAPDGSAWTPSNVQNLIVGIEKVT